MQDPEIRCHRKAVSSDEKNGHAGHLLLFSRFFGVVCSKFAIRKSCECVEELWQFPVVIGGGVFKCDSKWFFNVISLAKDLKQKWHFKNGFVFERHGDCWWCFRSSNVEKILLQFGHFWSLSWKKTHQYSSLLVQEANFGFGRNNEPNGPKGPSRHPN